MNNSHTASHTYLFPFEKDGDLSIIECDTTKNPVWSELSDTLKRYSTQRPMLLSIPECQIEPLFYCVCKELGVTTVIGTVYNLPLTRELIKTAKPDMLVLHEKLVNDFARSFLVSASDQLSSLQTIFVFGNQSSHYTETLQKQFPNLHFIAGKYPLYE